MSPQTKKIALIDGYGFVFRAFHALPPMKREDGTPIGAVYGFTNMLIKLLANLNVSHAAVVFDSGSKTFRNQIYPEYKAHRPPCPEELKPQFSIIREVAEALNLAILEKVGFEADDLIATVARQAEKQNFQVLIISSDKDLMQLVNSQILLYDGLKNKIIGEQEVMEKFLVKPCQVLDVLSLMGDASDNIPGIKGIGPKIAAELINQYQNLENLLENLSEIKQEKRRETLIAGVEMAKLSKQLVTLCENVPISDNMQDYLMQNINGRKLISFLEKQGFKSLVGRVRKDFNLELETAKELENLTVENVEFQNVNPILNSKTQGFLQVKKTIVVNIVEIEKLLEAANLNGNLVIDFEFIQKQPSAAILSSFDSSGKITEIFYVQLAKAPENHSTDLFFNQEKSSLQSINNNAGVNIDELLAALSPILLDKAVNKIGYFVKNLFSYLLEKLEQTAISNWQDQDFDFDDIALMGYVLNSNENKANLDLLAIANLTDNPIDFFGNFSELWQKANKQISQNGENHSKLTDYKNIDIFDNFEQKVGFYCLKIYLLTQLYPVLRQRIFAEKLNYVYYCLEKPLIRVLSDIEKNGILVDKSRLQELSAYFKLEIKKLDKEIISLAKEEFNIASPKQLADVLFNKLSLKTGKKSLKTGAFSTNSEVLEELDLAGHLIAGKILQWRQFSKLESTYCQGLQACIKPETKRIHTTLSNTSTSTGRLSSYNPNLQNIPIKTTQGKKIRSAFIAKPDFCLISADYSQIELRVLAIMANIPKLKEAFLAGKDIHRITAAQVFGANESEVSDDMRRKAKAINFGIIYGISAFGLAKQLKIGRSEAANYIENYFITYPGIKEYMQESQELARQNGFVKTITGRKCFIENINSKNPAIKGLAERLAINAPIQGSAADIIKIAMINFNQALFEFNQNHQMLGENAGKIILQIHDELLIEAPKQEAEELANLLKTIMGKAMLLDVPLKVDVKISDSWE